MRLNKWLIRIFAIMCLVALTACSATPTPTFTFQRTRTIRVPTETPVESTNTPAPTSTPQPTSTPATTPTPAPTATVDPALAAQACDSAEFAGNITYFDGTKVGPAHPFQKTWQIRNTSSCTWSSDFTLVYVNGTRFGGDTAVSVPGPIGPGQFFTISANLIAPTDAGTYTSYWMMRDDTGHFFGFGPAGKDPIHVTIVILNLPVNATP